MNPSEEDQKKANEIVRLTKQVRQIIQMGLDENYFTPEELTDIQGQMNALIEQGVFWLKQKNQDRFIYELRNFLKWLVDFWESKKGW